MEIQKISNLVQLAHEIEKQIDSLVQKAEKAGDTTSLDAFFCKVFNSVLGELRTARENAAIFHLLDVLNHVNAAIMQKGDFERRKELLDMIANVILELEDADIVVLYEVPETGERLKARPGTAGNLYFPEMMLDEINPSSPVSDFLRQDSPTYIANVQEDERLVGESRFAQQDRFPNREQVKSVVVAPLRFIGSPVGLLFINYREQQEFGAEQQRRIEEIVGHIALTLHTIRSYRRSIEYRQQLQGLFHIIDEITRHAVDRQKILDIAIRGMVRLIDAPRGAIVRWDSGKEEGVVVAEYSENGHSFLGATISRRTSQLQQRVLKGEVCAIHNVETAPELSRTSKERLLAAGVKSLLIVPVVDEKDEVIASIGIDETRWFRRFRQEEINLCETLARQLATALRLADSTEEVRHRANIHTLQQEAISFLVDGTDPDPAFELIVNEGLKLIGASNGQLLRLSQDQKFLETDYSTNPKEIGLRYPVEKSVTGKAVLTRSPVLIRDLSKERELGSLYQPGYESGMKAELTVPLLDEHGQVIGVLNAESPTPNAFRQEHERIWSLLSQSIAKIVQLAQAVAEKNALTSLNETQLVILQQPNTDLTTILRDILDKALEFADATKNGIGQLLLLSDDKNELEIFHSNHPEDIGKTVQVDHSISGLAVKRKGPVYVADLSQEEDPEFGPYRDLHQWFGDRKMHSELAVPMIFGGEVIGVINLEKETTFAFTELHARLVNALASQAAMIIQQSRLLQQEESLLEREVQQRLEIQQSRDIANILHRLNNPLGLIRQYAKLARGTLEDPSPDIESVREDMSKIEKSVTRTANLVLELRSQLRSVEARPTDVLQEIERARSAWLQELRDSDRKRVTLQVISPPENLPLASVGDKLGYVLRDIFNNALEAVEADRGCVIAVNVEHVERQEGKFVDIHVQDNGCGIPKNKWELVFDEAFHTPKPNRLTQEGGIGLWWDRRYVRGYGGDVFVSKSEIGQGTTMTVRLKQWEK